MFLILPREKIGSSNTEHFLFSTYTQWACHDGIGTLVFTFCPSEHIPSQSLFNSTPSASVITALIRLEKMCQSKIKVNDWKWKMQAELGMQAMPAKEGEELSEQWWGIYVMCWQMWVCHNTLDFFKGHIKQLMFLRPGIRPHPTQILIHLNQAKGRLSQQCVFQLFQPR